MEYIHKLGKRWKKEDYGYIRKSKDLITSIKSKKQLSINILAPISSTYLYTSGSIVIRRKAKIDPLENAKILTNDITKYFNIYDATVEISTRHDYLASGIYDYKDLNGDIHNIFFSEIKPDTTAQTHGYGTIKKNKDFKLSPNYDFYGDVKLSSTIENLEFSGYAKIVHSCKNIDKKWIDFT